jgi:hypothetical protein
MPRAEPLLILLNRFFGEAIRQRPGDAREIAHYIEARIEALAPEKQAAMRVALARSATFRAPNWRSEKLN